VAPHRARCATVAEVNRWAHEVEHTVRAELNFAIDGGVVKVDRVAVQQDLGSCGGREPRWATARKFAADIAETTLLDIKVNTGPHGRAHAVRGAGAGAPSAARRSRSPRCTTPT
jgi:DNA ligase (NAD+)